MSFYDGLSDASSVAWDGLKDWRRGEAGLGEVARDVFWSVWDRQNPYLQGIPDKVWNEHGFVWGASGCHKSAIFELLLKKRIPDALRGKCSVVLIDGSVFPERVNRYVHKMGKLNHDRFVLIDPSVGENLSLDHLPPMNVFDIPEALRGKLSADYLIGTYVGLCGGLLRQELTQLMETLFTYAVQLMFCFPKPTLKTLQEILIDPEPYLERAEGLSPDVRDFFVNSVMVPRSKYDATRRDVASRIEGLKGRPVVRRLMCSEDSTMNLFDKINAGGVFNIATRQAQLADDGTRVIGRFILNTLHRITQSRANEGVGGVQTFVMIDELQDYMINGYEPSVAKAHRQARKYGVSYFSATQSPLDFHEQMFNILTGSSSIQLFGRQGPQAAAKTCRAARVHPDELLELKNGNFICRRADTNKEPLLIDVPAGSLGRFRNDKQKREMEAEGHAATRLAKKIMAERYGEVQEPSRIKWQSPTGQGSQAREAF